MPTLPIPPVARAALTGHVQTTLILWLEMRLLGRSRRSRTTKACRAARRAGW